MESLCSWLPDLLSRGIPQEVPTPSIVNTMNATRSLKLCLDIPLITLNMIGVGPGYGIHKISIMVDSEVLLGRNHRESTESIVFGMLISIMKGS